MSDPAAACGGGDAIADGEPIELIDATPSASLRPSRAAAFIVVTVATVGRATADDVTGEQIEIIDTAPTAPGQTRIDAKTARSVPGGDAGKVAQSLPGVARPAAGSADLVVWGAAASDTRVFVDGMPVPALYHLGGYRSAIGDGLIGDIRLTPAAFGADRGGAIGGVIDVGLADPATVPPIRLQADVLDVSVGGSAKLGERTTFAIAARRSWLDRAVDLVGDPRELAPNVPLPRWLDSQVVVRSRLRQDLTLTATTLSFDDTLDRTLVSDDPATETVQSISRQVARVQVALRHDRPDGFDSAMLWYGHELTSDLLDVGDRHAGLGVNRELGGGRAIQQDRLNDHATLAIGLDLVAERGRYRRSGSLSIPAREGDLQIFGQPPGDDAGADRWSATTIDGAGYSALDLRAGRLTATIGARGDAWQLGASRLTPRIGATPGIASQQIEFTIDPRATVAVQLSDELSLRADGGRYHQARDGADASAVFGTPDLGLESALHATIGAQWRRAPLALELVAYGRKLDDLVARDLAVTPLFARALTQAGSGDVIGVQATARVVDHRGLTGWLSYNLSRSRRRDAPNTPERLFDHDQTHGLIAVAAWKHGPYTLGGRVRVASGEPRTGVIGAVFDSRSGRFEPVRGEHNGTRLPTFFAADARGERGFASGRWRGAVYLELQNLTDRANAEEIIYSADFSRRGYLASLPLLAIAGVRLEL